MLDKPAKRSNAQPMVNLKNLIVLFLNRSTYAMGTQKNRLNKSTQSTC